MGDGSLVNFFQVVAGGAGVLVLAAARCPTPFARFLENP
jgi:hypothetical protein